MTHDVFISYSSEDSPTANAICARLEQKGIRCWIAPRDVVPGHEWSEALVKAIRASKAFVLVFSSYSNHSPQVRREVDRAVQREIPIIPFRIENVLPEPGMEYYLSVPHWLDAITPPLEKHIEALSETLASLLRSPVTRSDTIDAGTELPSTPFVSPPPLSSPPKAYTADITPQKASYGSGTNWLRPFATTWTRMRLKHRVRQEKCPYCESWRSLVDDPGEPTLKRCKAVVDHHGTKCPYRVLRRLSELPVLNFVLVGMAKSGKTTWTASLLGELSRGGQWPFVELNDADAERQRRQLTNERLMAPLTGDDANVRWDVSTAQPYFLEGVAPTNFGRWSFVVQLIEFAGGELLANLKDVYRQRAMRSDGILLFISPDQDPALQSAALRCLREDLQHSRNTTPHVAVCFSKLDLLPDSEPLIQSLLAAQKQPVSLSRLEQQQEILCQGFVASEYSNIGPILKSQFPSRHLIVPVMTGGNQTSKGTHTAAIGAVEPLLWLLHSNRVIDLPE